MRLSKNLVALIAVAAACPGLAADPVPPANPEPVPALPIAPAKAPAPDAEKALHLDDPVSRPVPSPLPLPSPLPSLLPDDIPVARKVPPSPNRATADKPSATPNPREAGEELDLRIRYRKARSVAETNEKVRAAWGDSRHAKTEYAKRQALKRYYDLLFAKMLTVDRSIEPLVEKRRKTEFSMLTQTRIAPTVPNE